MNCMKQAEFVSSIESSPEPLATLSTELQSLWWLKKGDWNKAHDLAQDAGTKQGDCCLLYTSPSPRDGLLSRMPSSA